MLLFLRHAHAGDKHHWQGPDSLRPQSAAGQTEAARLLVRLEDCVTEASAAVTAQTLLSKIR